jgi:hypothetical protein
VAFGIDVEAVVLGGTVAEIGEQVAVGGAEQLFAGGAEQLYVHVVADGWRAIGIGVKPTYEPQVVG